MENVIFDFYEITYRGRNYRILQPRDIGQFWLINQLDGGCNWTEVNFYGNREGLNAWGNACGALVGDEPLLVYFPCKRNRGTCEIFSVYDAESWDLAATTEFLDLVLMKPGTLKISDWKGIRACLAKEKAKNRSVSAEYVLKNRRVKEKYKYRSEKKEVIRFDTLFYNFPHYEYLELASQISRFLDWDREKDFSEDIRSGGKRLRGEKILFECGGNVVWISFWDNEIWHGESRRFAYAAGAAHTADSAGREDSLREER